MHMPTPLLTTHLQLSYNEINAKQGGVEYCQQDVTEKKKKKKITHQ